MRICVWAFLIFGFASPCLAQEKKVPIIEDASLDTDGIELEFDRPMLTWAGKNQQPNIKIKPEVDCKWTWQDDTAFVCNTDEDAGQIKPATRYTISIGEGFKSQEGVPLAPTTLNLKTDGPVVRAFIPEWIKGQPSIHLMSTMPVTAAAMREKLSVLVNAKPVPFELREVKKKLDEDGPEDLGIVYAVTYGEVSLPNALLSFVLKPGLKSPLGPVRGEQKGEFLIARLNTAFKLNQIQCQNKQQYTRVQVEKVKSGGIKCDPNMPILFGFSDAIEPASLAKFAASLPAGFTFKETELRKRWLYQDSYYYYNSKAPAEKPSVSYELIGAIPASQYLLEYPSGFVSIEADPIEKSAELLFEIGDLPKTILVKPGVKTQFPGEHEITRLEVVNSSLKTTKINFLNISDSVAQSSSTYSLEQEKNKSLVLDMPLPDKKIQAAGGLMLAGSDEVQGLGFSFAYVPFNVLHYQARNQVLVWATDWRSGKPIANARVEIIRIDKQRKAVVAATGMSDASGVAEIDFDNRKILPDDQMSLIRVTHGEQRVVSPALFSSGSSLNFKSTWEDWHYKIASKKKVFSFGVTELPLYRPGEKVNYRIWQRQKINNHLKLIQADGPVSLQLRDNNKNKTLQTWQAQLDANGSVSGNLMLSQLLPDGLYCITSGDTEQYRNGACFRVARFEAQPLWAKLSADKTSVLAGQSIHLDFDSGYFSGGPAAGLELKFESLSTPKRFESVYPEFQAYSFINPFGDDDPDEEDYRGDDPLKGKATPRKTGSEGEAGFHLTLDTPILLEDSKTELAFGTLEFSAEVRIPGKASASSETLSVNYAKYESYVGLKTKEWWLRQDQDPGLEAVVVSHDGKAIPGEAVVVSIFRLLKDKKESPVGECNLVSGQAMPCSFRTSEPGQYLFRANSKNSAQTELIRYIGNAYQKEISEDEPKASLTLIRASDGKSSARVQLSQPYPKATALFTLEYDQIVQHWVRVLESTEAEIEIPIKSEWAPGLSLRVIVRPANAVSAADAKKLNTLEALIDLDIPRLQSDALTVTTSKKSYKPDEEIELLISNPSSTARFVTVSVIDDSVYQQGNEVWNMQDPNNNNWLGALKQWEMSSWYGFETWRYTNNIFFKDSTKKPGVSAQQTGQDGRKQELQILTRADVERTGLNNVYEVLNSITGSDGSGLSVIQTRSFERKEGDNGIAELEQVTVVGSRIKRVDQDNSGETRYLSLGGCDSCDVVQVSGAKINRVEPASRSPAAQLVLDRAKNNPGKPMPRVRSQFVDAAYWNPDIVLAAGESRKIKFKLPDNLTQWRVLLWSADDSDGFAQSQITFDTSLPIELRTGLPSQIFVGDKANAQISARNQTDTQVEISLKTALNGSGVEINKNNKAMVKPYEVLEQNLDFAPTQPGALDVLSVADSSKDTDGLSSGTVVQSRFGMEQIPQSGWLDMKPLNLSIPKLPSSAVDSKIDLQVSRGFSSWADGWLNDLQDYPHRCWEQTLSRAVGAAYAQAYDKQSLWADRQTTINDALQVATSFQDEDGYYRYFQNQNVDGSDEPNLILSAYTLKAFHYLQTLGYPVQKELVSELNEDLPQQLKRGTKLDGNGEPNIPWETTATIAGVIETPEDLDSASLQSLWDHWEKLSWFARTELLQAMSRKPQFVEQMQQGIQLLRDAGDKRGLRQVIGDSRDFSYFMGSDLRDQCAVVSTLWKLDKSEEGRPARERLLRGIYDLYAGGTASLDTQSSAQCLMALHDVTRQNVVVAADARIAVSLDAKTENLNLASDTKELNWQTDLSPASKKLSLATDNTAGGTMNYSAVISYQYDLQQAEGRGVGLNLQRHYDVLRNGKWVPLLDGSLNEGDWVRVRLIVNAPAERHFVAVSDFAPGGLVTRDITLSSVGGADIKNIGGNGSYYFDSRQTGSSVVRIYAEYLPAGRHEIYYYAQAVHSGDYFAPPAIAELMYGRASRANTASDRVVVRPGK